MRDGWGAGPHPASPITHPVYSYLNASTGSSLAALLAGYRPNPMPVRAEAARAASTDQSGTCAGMGVRLAVGGRRGDRQPHQSPRVRHVFDGRAVRNADVRWRRTAEQVRRRHVDADHLERGTGNVDRLADRVAPAEQLFLELRVNHRH